MVEASPKIAYESASLSVPLFPSSALLLGLGKPQAFSPQRLGQAANPGNSQLCKDKGSSGCPNILVCDDDSFQTMYYKIFFEGIFNSQKETRNKPDPRLDIFSSGEPLVERFLKTTTCGCGSPLLIVTDYSMGKGKMNGIQTIQTLRKFGFNGDVVLRTSEDKAYLTKQHPDFEAMLKSGFISHFVEKSNQKKTKEIIQGIIKEKAI